MKIVVNMDKKFFIFLVLTIFLTSFIGISGAVPPGPPYNPGHFANQVDFSTPINQPVTINGQLKIDTAGTDPLRLDFNYNPPVLQNLRIFTNGEGIIFFSDALVGNANLIAGDLFVDTALVTELRLRGPSGHILRGVFSGTPITSSTCQEYCVVEVGLSGCLFRVENTIDGSAVPTSCNTPTNSGDDCICKSI